MDEDPGLSERYRMASPWPMFVALGIPVSELGLLFDLFPVAVAGLILFCGSVTGILHEAGYVDNPWRAAAVFAVVLLLAGGGLVVSGVGGGSLQLGTRGYAIVAAGVIMLAGGVAGELFVPEREGTAV